MELTLCISYALLCVAKSAFIIGGSRGPANLAMALGRRLRWAGLGPQASPGHIPLPCGPGGASASQPALSAPSGP